MKTDIVASVIMTAYNAEDYIAEAIKSILNQTFREFEFIIVDDASTDRTNLIIQSFADDRINVIRNNSNLGVSKSSNIGLSYAKGKYIIRADADDINLEDRFEKQISYMERHPEIVLSSCGMIVFGENIEKRNKVVELNNQEIKAHLIFDCVLPHPGFIFRREICKNNGYDETLRYALDYEFQARVSLQYPISCMKEIEVMYRVSENQISTKKYVEQQECANIVRKRMFQHYGIELNENKMKCIQLLSTGRIKEMTTMQFVTAIKILSALKRNAIKCNCSEKLEIQELCDDMRYRMRVEVLERVRYVLKFDKCEGK